MSVISVVFAVLDGIILYVRVGAFLFAMRCVFYYYDVLHLKKKCLTHLHEVVFLAALVCFAWEIKEVLFEAYLLLQTISRISFWVTAIPVTLYVWSKFPSMLEDFRE